MPSSLDTMALTVYGEARGEVALGQAGVAWVIKRRADNPRWWGKGGVTSVCLAPSQFSCWDPADPNSDVLADVGTLTVPLYRSIRVLCEGVLCNEVPDPTKGADHYCVTKIADKTKWARGKVPVQIIGNHSFYRLEV